MSLVPVERFRMQAVEEALPPFVLFARESVSTLTSVPSRNKNQFSFPFFVKKKKPKNYWISFFFGILINSVA